MLLRPYPDGRQRQLPFIRPRREPFYGRMTQRCRRWETSWGPMTQRRRHWIPFYRRLAATRCRFLLGTSGAYAFAPYPTGRQGRPPFIRRHWKPFYRRLAATRRRFLLGISGGVCNTPLPYRPTGATAIHSPPSGTILWADDPKVSPRVGAYCIRPTQCPSRGNYI